MKILAFMNGWKEAPHCWLHHLSIPFWVSRYYENTFEVKLFGFAWFVEFAA